MCFADSKLGGRLRYKMSRQPAPYSTLPVLVFEASLFCSLLINERNGSNKCDPPGMSPAEIVTIF